MKIKLPCFACFHENGKSEPVFSYLELGENNVHEVNCENGHTTFIGLTQHKHEVLFELGAMALVDGYPREAIATIAAALERFYELCIRVISAGLQIPDEELKKAWKLIDMASERQFGAFSLTMLLWLKECPPVIDNVKPTLPGISQSKTKNWKEFRNQVIHKGLMPSQIVSIEYCELVYAHINDLTRQITKQFEAEWLKEANRQANEAQEENPDIQIVFTGIPTSLFMARGSQAPLSFKEALQQMDGYRGLYVR